MLRQGNDPYSNTYNLGWRNHPNFGWRNQEGQGNAQGSNQAGPSFQGGNRPPQQQGNYHHNQGHGNNSGARPQHPPSFQPQRNMDEGNMLAKLMEGLREMKRLQKNQAATNQMLKTQISQLAINLQGRPQGGLPFSTENNPREHVKAHVVEEDGPQIVVDIASSSQELPRECEEVVIEVEEPYVRLPPPPPFVPPVPLADALREMPQYAKFLKDIITNKRRNMSSINCLCDLGASINLMPLTLFRTLCGDQTVKSTSMVLQLADHSLKRPFGIVEDVLVKVDKFIFPVDFVILDYAVDKECSMILGRPFMNTGRALIDVHGGKLTLRIDEETVEFDMKKVMRGTIEEEECMRIDLVDELVKEQLEANLEVSNWGLELKVQEMGEHKLLHESCNPQKFGFTIRAKEEEVTECKAETCTIRATPLSPNARIVQVIFQSDDPEDECHDEEDPTPETLIKNGGVTPPSSQVPPQVEMKLLPMHLRYAFVGENETLPIIISDKLSKEQERRVVQVVKEHVLAMGWQISDIRGISPQIVMHKIHLEDESKKSTQRQRRLNPNMKEVVYKEIVKLLDARIIYPISDSEWVSPIA
ncbi:uncharacterized protein LOC126671757 [Mercurialis annua]|uniref:uncharacterized protein LOC126671757 n=1 Tax=Mercurialis annua TaxID=3986 RepID=UPI00215DFA82|nr:uncharacterized protein LOC126671757 [Mercurialis annua]